MSLKGRSAVVTGGGRGIGKAAARALAEAGARVMVASRSLEQVEAVAAELGARGFEVHAAQLDVASESSVAALFEAASRRLGDVDLLVNNAGIAASAPIKALELAEWNRIFAVNSTGTFLCTRAFAPAMAARGYGRIVNVASVAARMGAPYISAYTASKHAMLGFTRAAAAELSPKGVTVNAVCPGYVDTEMTVQTISNVMQRAGLDQDAALRAILDTVNQRRLVSPEEVAFVIAALCDENAGATTGQAIVIDAGGLLA